jgi:oleate hydratase
MPVHENHTVTHQLVGHLNFDLAVFSSANCIPCRMPYITSMFMPRAAGDRPLPVPKHSENFAFLSQFVEIQDDVVFTVEYSVRAAQMAVYQLLEIARPISPMLHHDESAKVKLNALIKAFK